MPRTTALRTGESITIALLTPRVRMSCRNILTRSVRSTFLRIAILAATAIVCGDVSRAAASDAEVDRVIARGLDWLAAHQSRLGHWTAERAAIQRP